MDECTFFFKSDAEALMILKFLESGLASVNGLKKF